MWGLTYARRAFLPERVDIDDRDEAGEHVVAIANAQSRRKTAVYRCDSMTDQFNIYRDANGRSELVAVYMVT